MKSSLFRIEFLKIENVVAVHTNRGTVAFVNLKSEEYVYCDQYNDHLGILLEHEVDFLAFIYERPFTKLRTFGRRYCGPETAFDHTEIYKDDIMKIRVADPLGTLKFISVWVKRGDEDAIAFLNLDKPEYLLFDKIVYDQVLLTEEEIDHLTDALAQVHDLLTETVSDYMEDDVEITLQDYKHILVS